MYLTPGCTRLMATIKDVARRVHKAIEQLNFRPSHTARALLSGSSQMIGVYIPILKGTFCTPRVGAEADEAEPRLVPGFPERTVSST